MFRIHDNVPEVYIKLSRDFQLIARLYDTIVSGVKYDIDTVVNLLDATQARDTVLELMCTKVGFFTRLKLDANVLKYIIASFPYILKNKGTAKGIEYAVNTILKAENTTDEFLNPYILIVNKATSNLFTDYTVYIYTTIDVYNRIALLEVLRYVLPVGYKYLLHSYARLNSGDAYTQFTQSDEYMKYPAFVPYVSSVRSRMDETKIDVVEYKYQSAYDVVEVITAEMAASDKSTSESEEKNESEEDQ